MWTKSGYFPTPPAARRFSVRGDLQGTHPWYEKIYGAALQMQALLCHAVAGAAQVFIVLPRAKAGNYLHFPRGAEPVLDPAELVYQFRRYGLYCIGVMAAQKIADSFHVSIPPDTF